MSDFLQRKAYYLQITVWHLESLAGGVDGYTLLSHKHSPTTIFLSSFNVLLLD